ncbi:hypothetical protein RB213_012792 [Colletotrichum asianum]
MAVPKYCTEQSMAGAALQKALIHLAVVGEERNRVNATSTPPRPNEVYETGKTDVGRDMRRLPMRDTTDTTRLIPSVSLQIRPSHNNGTAY